MTKENPPKISVIIPVKNGEKTIMSCLEAVFSQNLDDPFEVIIIDSGSTDQSLNIVSGFPIRLYKIPPDDFNHGATRQFGVTKAKGDFVVLTVQDAIPDTSIWIKTMYENFNDDKVMGVCGHQKVPHENDKNPLAWFRPVSKAKPSFIEFKPGEFDKLDGHEQHKYCGWENVNAMYRKSALLKTPFSATGFAEDSLWSKHALSKGYKLVIDCRARVNHYHHYTFKYAFNRTYTMSYYTKINFNYTRRHKSFIKSSLMILYRILLKKHVPNRKLYWIVYNFKTLIAGLIGRLLFRINSMIFSTEIHKKIFMSMVGKLPEAKSVDYKNE